MPPGRRPLVLAVNPGSTSTRLALFECRARGEPRLLDERTLAHSAAELGRFRRIADQEPWRAALVERYLRERGARVEYRPEATCRHDGGRSDVRPEKSRLLARNAVRCVRRTQGRGAGVAAYVIVVLWNARLAIADGARAGLGRVPRTQAHARRAGFRAAIGSWRELR